MDKKLNSIEWDPVDILSEQLHDPDRVKVYFKQYGTAKGELNHWYKRGCALEISMEALISHMALIPEMGTYPIIQVPKRKIS